MPIVSGERPTWAPMLPTAIPGRGESIPLLLRPASVEPISEAKSNDLKFDERVRRTLQIYGLLRRAWRHDLDSAVTAPSDSNAYSVRQILHPPLQTETPTRQHAMGKV